MDLEGDLVATTREEGASAHIVIGHVFFDNHLEYSLLVSLEEWRLRKVDLLPVSWWELLQGKKI